MYTNNNLITILIIIIGILSCIIIWLWQHRSLDNSKNKEDYTESILNSIKKIKRDAEQEFYSDYLDKLISLYEEDLMEATLSWYSLIKIIDRALPFFKTGYISTFILDESRYLNIVKEIGTFDVVDCISKLKEMKSDIDTIDMEDLANKTLQMLRWFKDNRIGADK